MDDVWLSERRPVDVRLKHQGLRSLLIDTVPQLAVYLYVHRATTVCAFRVDDHRQVFVP